MEWNRTQLDDLKKRLFHDRICNLHALDEIISILHWWMIDHDLLLSANMTFDLAIDIEAMMEEEE